MTKPWKPHILKRNGLWIVVNHLPKRSWTWDREFDFSRAHAWCGQQNGTI